MASMDIEHLEPRLPQSPPTFAAAWKQTAKWRSEKLPSCCRTYLSKSSPRWAGFDRKEPHSVHWFIVIIPFKAIAFSSGEGMYMYVPNISEDSHVFPGLLFPGHSKSFSNNSFRLAKSSCAAACNTIDTCPVIARCARCARCFMMGWRGGANAKRLASKSTCIYESYMDDMGMLNDSLYFVLWCSAGLWYSDGFLDSVKERTSRLLKLYFSVDHPRVFDLHSGWVQPSISLASCEALKTLFPGFLLRKHFCETFRETFANATVAPTKWSLDKTPLWSFCCNWGISPEHTEHTPIYIYI